MKLKVSYKNTSVYLVEIIIVERRLINLLIIKYNPLYIAKGAKSQNFCFIEFKTTHQNT